MRTQRVSGFRASVDQTTGFLLQELRRCMSSVLSPEMRRRAGGRDLRIVFDEDTIAARVKELGTEITAAYPDGEVLVLGLLEGSFIFLSDLVRQINRPIHLDFLVASSYGNGTVSSGEVRLLYS